MRRISPMLEQIQAGYSREFHAPDRTDQITPLSRELMYLLEMHSTRARAWQFKIIGLLTISLGQFKFHVYINICISVFVRLLFWLSRGDLDM
jgi:hypothetical protein